MLHVFKKYPKKVVAATVLVLCFLVYWSVLGIGFLSDDWHAIYVAHTHENLFHFFFTNIVGTNVGSSYGPMWNMLMKTQYSIFGLHAAWYHIVSLILFSAIGYMVALLAYEGTKKWPIAIAAGAIFITLSSHGETVSWISSQPHLLATLGYVMSVLCYFYFLKQRKKSWYIFSMIAFAVSLLTKEIGITAPAVFFLLEVWQAREQKKDWKMWVKHVLQRMSMPVLFVLIYLFLRRHATGIGAGYYGDAGLSVFDFIRQLSMVIEMTVQLFVPYPLRQTIIHWVVASYAWLWGSVLLVIGICCTKNKLKWILFGVLGIYFVSLVPYLPLSLDPIGNGGERYTLLPAVWMSIFLAVSIYAAITSLYTVSKKRLWFAYGAVVLCLSAVGIVILQAKLTHWQQAGNVVQTGITQLQNATFSEDDYIYLVGAPTNIQGAQMFLNGTFLALELQGGSISGERILMMSTLPPDDPKKDFVQVREDEEHISWHIIDPHYSFMGLPTLETEIGTFVLEEFDKSNHTGQRIIFEKNRKNITALKQEKKAVYVMYYTGGKFHKIKL